MPIFGEKPTFLVPWRVNDPNRGYEEKFRARQQLLLSPQINEHVHPRKEALHFPKEEPEEGLTR